MAKLLVKKKKKKWFNIIAPSFLKSEVVGETLASDPRLLEGRTLRLSLSEITRNIKDQNRYITLQINRFSQENAYTFVKRIGIPNSFIKRFVRKRTTKISDSFLTLTKDKKTVRIKPIVVTRNKIKGIQSKFLRKKIRITIKKMVSEYKYADLIQAIIFQKLQKELKKAGLNKISPIKYLDIKTIEVLSKKEIEEAEKEGEKVEKEELSEEEKKIEEEMTQKNEASASKKKETKNKESDAKNKE